MKIALFGYGKMGKEIEKIALQRGHTIGLVIDINNASNFSQEALKACDAAIEFTTPETAIGNIYKCFDVSVPVVVGTTGWLNSWQEVREACTKKEQTLFWTSNFSIGVNLFFQLNEYLAKLMAPYADYNVIMEEIHHVHKKDSPSGTGITLAEGVIRNYPNKKKWKEAEAGNVDELLINSKREGEVPGTHIIKYTSAVDDIEIAHIAHNRIGFALGAVMAAEWVKDKKGVFGMKDMLKL